MDLDQAFFLGIALVGALFLLVSFIIGEVGEFFDDVGDFVGEHVPDIGAGGDAGAGVGETSMEGGDEGPSPLSLRSLMAFMTAYGASGLITSSYDWSTLASSLFAILPGMTMAFAAYQVMRLLYGQQASSVVEIGQLNGRTGVVDVAIPAAGVGKVTISTHNGSGTFIARSEGGAEIGPGEQVIVKGSLGSELVVSKLEAPERG
jgi:membrane protein implicated in regulation of membrane protease activity